MTNRRHPRGYPRGYAVSFVLVALILVATTSAARMKHKKQDNTAAAAPSKERTNPSPPFKMDADVDLVVIVPTIPRKAKPGRISVYVSDSVVSLYEQWRHLQGLQHPYFKKMEVWVVNPAKGRAGVPEHVTFYELQDAYEAGKPIQTSGVGGASGSSRKQASGKTVVIPNDDRSFKIRFVNRVDDAVTKKVTDSIRSIFHTNLHMEFTSKLGRKENPTVQLRKRTQTTDFSALFLSFLESVKLTHGDYRGTNGFPHLMLWEDDCTMCAKGFEFLSFTLNEQLEAPGKPFGFLKVGMGGSGILFHPALLPELTQFLLTVIEVTPVDVAIHEFYKLYSMMLEAELDTPAFNASNSPIRNTWLASRHFVSKYAYSDHNGIVSSFAGQVWKRAMTTDCGLPLKIQQGGNFQSCLPGSIKKWDTASLFCDYAHNGWPSYSRLHANLLAATEQQSTTPLAEEKPAAADQSAESTSAVSTSVQETTFIPPGDFGAYECSVLNPMLFNRTTGVPIAVATSTTAVASQTDKSAAELPRTPRDEERPIRQEEFYILKARQLRTRRAGMDDEPQLYRCTRRPLSKTSDGGDTYVGCEYVRSDDTNARMLGKTAEVLAQSYREALARVPMAQVKALARGAQSKGEEIAAAEMFVVSTVTDGRSPSTASHRNEDSYQPNFIDVCISASVKSVYESTFYRNCQYTLWGSWSACSADCGDKGVRTRTRQIHTSAIGELSTPCMTDSLVQEDPCNRFPCPTPSPSRTPTRTPSPSQTPSPSSSAQPSSSPVWWKAVWNRIVSPHTAEKGREGGEKGGGSAGMQRVDDASVTASRLALAITALIAIVYLYKVFGGGGDTGRNRWKAQRPLGLPIAGDRNTSKPSFVIRLVIRLAFLFVVYHCLWLLISSLLLLQHDLVTLHDPQSPQSTLSNTSGRSLLHLETSVAAGNCRRVLNTEIPALGVRFRWLETAMYIEHRVSESAAANSAPGNAAAIAPPPPPAHELAGVRELSFLRFPLSTSPAQSRTRPSNTGGTLYLGLPFVEPFDDDAMIANAVDDSAQQSSPPIRLVNAAVEGVGVGDVIPRASALLAKVPSKYRKVEKGAYTQTEIGEVVTISEFAYPLHPKSKESTEPETNTEETPNEGEGAAHNEPSTARRLLEDPSSSTKPIDPTDLSAFNVPSQLSMSLTITAPSLCKGQWNVGLVLSDVADGQPWNDSKPGDSSDIVTNPSLSKSDPSAHFRSGNIHVRWHVGIPVLQTIDDHRIQRSYKQTAVRGGQKTTLSVQFDIEEKELRILDPYNDRLVLRYPRRNFMRVMYAPATSVRSGLYTMEREIDRRRSEMQRHFVESDVGDVVPVLVFGRIAVKVEGDRTCWSAGARVDVGEFRVELQ